MCGKYNKEHRIATGNLIACISEVELKRVLVDDWSSIVKWLNSAFIALSR
jgi:hypothetical protein